MNDDNYEIVTVYRGKDSATYLASEFMELGDKATPIAVHQNPMSAEPWHEMKLEDVDSIEFYKPGSQEQGTDLPRWDLKALKGLLEAQE